MIANETTLHKRPNETEIHNYRSPFDFPYYIYKSLRYVIIEN